ncbi:hypothetical protein GH714_016193 [Hevea brasiliensis]|uniref:Peptidase A1 domain-containing protein n=1 Tax=Hevea brasiliensis TaxID=3981 RepID=A0A6A6M0F8_HEVBR|nr:hypothetical protein GH714_016193 [Hevea brasiliensis]
MAEEPMGNQFHETLKRTRSGNAANSNKGNEMGVFNVPSVEPDNPETKSRRLSNETEERLSELLPDNKDFEEAIVAAVLGPTSESGKPVEIGNNSIFQTTTRLKVLLFCSCGQRQTGSFLDGAAPNGLFGLVQLTTSASVKYMWGNDSNLEFTAIFDTGTSFTYLNDPAYSFISESFNNQAKDKRYLSDPGLPFEYCYEMSSIQAVPELPILNLVMKGGSQFNVTDPLVIVGLPGNTNIYCLGVVKSGNVNIIGQNFMTGYRIVFDRERNVLGWKPSNCYDLLDTNILPVNPITPGGSPSTTVNPEATAGNSNNPNVFGEPSSSGNGSPQLNSFTFAFITVLISFFTV